MFNQYTYLYVEDDPLSREIMEMIMVNAMQIERLTVFENSQQFMERVNSLPYCPDVVLLDIHMKPLTGFEMLSLLRADANFQDSKIIALTASVMNEEVEKLRTSGFNGAIAKPLSISTFPDLIQRILAGEAIWHIAED